MKKLWEIIKKRKWLILGLVVVVAIGGVYYSRQQAAKKQVVTVKPEVRDIVESLDVSGNIDAHEKADLKFAAASKLTWLPIKEGDTVNKWQAIAAVDSRQLQKQLAIDQNLHGIQFRTTEGVFDTNDLYGGQGLTESERRTVESSQLSLRNTALTVEYQDIAVKNATMVSPIKGLVTRIDQPNVGATTLPTDIFEIVNPQTVYFAVIVDEADVGQVNASQSAEITLDAFPDDTLTANVERIAFTPSQSQSGSLGYKVSLSLPVDNSLQKYRLGMSGDAKIILNKKSSVLSIPTDAIVEREGKQSVEVMKNGKPEKVEVVTGISDGDYTEIISGLTENDLVVMPGK
jgi:HlyD family secretion protein